MRSKKTPPFPLLLPLPLSCQHTTIVITHSRPTLSDPKNIKSRTLEKEGRVSTFERGCVLKKRRGACTKKEKKKTVKLVQNASGTQGTDTPAGYRTPRSVKKKRVRCLHVIIQKNKKKEYFGIFCAVTDPLSERSCSLRYCRYRKPAHCIRFLFFVLFCLLLCRQCPPEVGAVHNGV